MTNTTIQFSVIGWDQYDLLIDINKTKQWSVVGGIGTINASGKFTAGNTSGTGKVKAGVNSFYDSVDVEVVEHIYGIFSETPGITEKLKMNVNNPPDTDGGGLNKWEWGGAWGGGGITTTAMDVKEGNESIYFSFWSAEGGGSGLNIQFGYNSSSPPGTEREKDLSAFAGGKLCFWIRTEYNIQIEMEGPKDTYTNFRLFQDLGKSASKDFQYVEIPIANFDAKVDLSRIICPLKFRQSNTIVGNNISGTIIIDDIKLVK